MSTWMQIESERAFARATRAARRARMACRLRRRGALTIDAFVSAS